MRRLIALVCLSLCPLAVAACATTTSTANFKGSEHAVAQTIANLQSDITSGEQKKVCERDLAAAVVSRLGGRQRCESTIKDQIAEIDSTELQVESVKVSGETATASVKSIYGGKKRLRNVSLAKEAGGWRIAAIQ